MNIIRFSQTYDKMHNNHYGVPRKAILMEVFRVKTEDLHKRFVEYDTSYFDNETKELAYYKLPPGEVMVLLLKSNDMIWTTIRRYTPQKHKYYMNCRWKEFAIEVK